MRSITVPGSNYKFPETSTHYDHISFMEKWRKVMERFHRENQHGSDAFPLKECKED